MEIYQLKYFVEVAKKENMNHVTRDLGISTPALSKAISLLESELGVQLFERQGKRLKLNSKGKAFLMKSSQILDLIQEAAAVTKSTPSQLNVTIAGGEIFLGTIFLPLIQSLRRMYPDIQVNFVNCTEDEALKHAANGNCDFAITTQRPPDHFAQKQIFEFEMVACLGINHPLYAQVQKGKIFPISQVIQEAFVAPNTIIYGELGGGLSYDGWRDDIHPRNIKFVTSSLQLILDIVHSGEAIAYLPKFYADKMELARIKISGCKFKCLSQVYLSTTKQQKIGWVANALSNFKIRPKS